MLLLIKTLLFFIKDSVDSLLYNTDKIFYQHGIIPEEEEKNKPKNSKSFVVYFDKNIHKKVIYKEK